ncbi:MAG: cytidine deaminase [Blastocatellia bacterium]
MSPSDASNFRTREELLALAREVRDRAHAPYSNFKVGAAVESADGRVFTGCNVENSSYGVTICAEQVALGKAISEGAVEFVRVVVIADTHSAVPPCGACRQVILELCGSEVEIVMANLQGQVESRTAGELLPAAFDQSFL